MIALFGSKGFVGSEISKELKKIGYEVLDVTRKNHSRFMGGIFDYVINAAAPGARFRANNNPDWDFEETVAKTARIFYGTTHNKFIQISSISARCQPDVAYGRNKLAAESLVNDGNSLIVRLGPMYGPTLEKGVLIDMLKGGKVYVDGKSKYAFSPLNFNARWIARNLDKKGIIEVGAKNSIALEDLADELGLKVDFNGGIDNQEIYTIEPGYPDVNLVVDFMLNHPLYKNGRK